MASTSAHFNLTKPATTDYYNIGVFNDNTDIIDTQMYNNQVSAAKIMVGATANDDGESGRVPVPHAGDQNKYLCADGTWKTVGGGGGGASAVSDLTDVNLTNLANGQILKYNSTSQKWENANESGGGGGTGESFEEAQLYKASSLTFSNITVDWNWNDYDLYIFYTNDSLAQSGESTVITKEKILDLITNQADLSLYPYASGGTCIYKPTSNQITAYSQTQGFAITEIIGCKFAGSSSSYVNYSTTEQIVGSYMGETLYEIVIDNLSVQSSTSWTNITTIQGGKDLIDFKAWGYFSEYFLVNYNQAHIDTATGTLEVKFVEGGRTITRIAVQYTKTGGNQ